MTKQELLEESIVKIASRAGLATSGTFHLTSVSRDFGGVYILEVMSYEKARFCDEVRGAVTNFPPDAERSGTCMTCASLQGCAKKRRRSLG